MASELLVNKITPESGTTLTLGDSGDTISFASGVLPSLESLTITGDLTVDTDTLYVDSANNRVGVGTSSPEAILHISTGGGITPFASTQIVSESSGNNYIELNGGSTSTTALYFGDSSDQDIGGVLYNHSDDSLSFRANASSRMLIDSSGHAIIPNGVTLGTAAGTYNAANTLDDYEEGTFTATVTIGGVSTGTTIASNYRKIGKLVCYTIFTGSSITKGALTGDIQITGLPFTASSTTSNITNGIVRWGGINSGGTVIAVVSNNTTTIILQNYNSTGGFVDGTDSNDVGAGFNIYTVTGFYFID